MKSRIKKFEDTSPIEILLLREKLELKKYRKTVRRDQEKRKILIDLELKKIKEREKEDFILIGTRRRKVNIL